jgi:hypothetical protein
MFRRLGGVTGFATTFKAELDAAREVAPGSRRVCNMLLAIMKILETVSATRPDPTDHSRMTDQELDESIRTHIIELIAEQPILAVVAAHEIGWTVIPPEADGDAHEVTEDAVSRSK